MKTSLDCIPCFLRQALEAIRMVSTDRATHERIVREVLRWVGEMDFNQPPPVFAQHIHRQLREITGNFDPYREAKNHFNQMAMRLLPELKAGMESTDDRLMTAVRLAIAGNVIDMGIHCNISESTVRRSFHGGLDQPFSGGVDGFRQAVAEAQSILYLADNAGEIVFDRILVEELSPERVTVAVRGAPVINDATIEDARATRLNEIVEVIDNGSDAPGTILGDCSQEFKKRFAEADLIIAKGQGNFETLSHEPGNIFFLFQVKCPVVEADVGLAVGTHALVRFRASISN